MVEHNAVNVAAVGSSPPLQPLIYGRKTSITLVVITPTSINKVRFIEMGTSEK